MGRVINTLRRSIYIIAEDNIQRLWFGGFFITLFVVSTCGLIGWSIEQISINFGLFYSHLALLIALASSLAAGSLRKSVLDVLIAISYKSQRGLEPAREKLGLIVGRDVDKLTQSEILRATAETASENSVDGVFAPLFWMFFGSTLWSLNPLLPGPLAFVWAFKAASTLDSMIGYRTGKLLWLGATSARLDDLLTWVPCRLVLITLPIVSVRPSQIIKVIRKSLKEGSHDLSPNSGLSEAIFANCTGIQIGGTNSYKKRKVEKEILGVGNEPPSVKGIKKLLELSLRLELAWLLLFFIFTSIL